MHDHEFDSELRWSGSTRAGYRSFSRVHHATAAPSLAELTLSAGAAFRGDPEHLNPEQLLTVAASSCMMLTFLSIAALARADIVGYEDSARAVMPVDSSPMRVTTILLNPAVSIGANQDPDHVERMIHEAHETCFIANSLSCDILVTPKIQVVPAPS